MTLEELYKTCLQLAALASSTGSKGRATVTHCYILIPQSERALSCESHFDQLAAVIMSSEGLNVTFKKVFCRNMEKKMHMNVFVIQNYSNKHLFLLIMSICIDIPWVHVCLL